MTEKTDLSQRVIESIKESISAKERLLASAETIAAIARVSEVLIESLRAGHKLLLVWQWRQRRRFSAHRRRIRGALRLRQARLAGAGFVGQHLGPHRHWE